MVEAGVSRKVIEGTGSAGFGIWGSVDQTAYAGSVEGTSAHGARFEGTIEGAAGEAPAPHAGGSTAEGEEFSMGGRVFRGLTFVVSGGQYLLSPCDHGADGDFSLFGSPRGFFEGAAHKPQVPGGFGARLAQQWLLALVAAVGFKLFVHGSDNSSTVRHNQQRVHRVCWRHGRWVGFPGLEDLVERCRES
jgi:hypothetical protein